MNRIFFLIFSVVLFINTKAQQNIYVWKNGGELFVRTVPDSLTFTAGRGFLHISTLAPVSVGTTTFQASVNVSLKKSVNNLSKDPEIGVCFSSINVNPIYSDEHVCLGFSSERYDFTLYELIPGTTYYYRAYAKLGDEFFYGNVKTITTLGDKPIKPTFLLINGHKFVDLGLPSGLLWANSNIGAPFSSALGDFFAWGEIESKSYYEETSYKWRRSVYPKYGFSEELKSEDDVATIKWGNGWRIPSSTDFNELFNNCDWSWQSNYQGTKGYLITGANGNTIFLPVSGFRVGDNLYGKDWSGYYWSRSHVNLDCANCLYFYSDKIYYSIIENCWKGLLVRPVAEIK